MSENDPVDFNRWISEVKQSSAVWIVEHTLSFKVPFYTTPLPCCLIFRQLATKRAEVIRLQGSQLWEAFRCNSCWFPSYWLFVLRRCATLDWVSPYPSFCCWSASLQISPLCWSTSWKPVFSRASLHLPTDFSCYVCCHQHTSEYSISSLKTLTNS